MLQCPAVREGNTLDRRGRFITPRQLFNTQTPPLSLNTELHMQVSSIINQPGGNPAMGLQQPVILATLFLLDVGVLQTPASVRVEDCTLTYIMMTLLYQFQPFYQFYHIPAYHSRPAVKYLAGKCSPTPPGKKKKKSDCVRSTTIPSEGRH